MIRAFIDTDVILDYLSGRKQFATSAARVFESIHRGQVKAYTSSLSFSNLYYVLRKHHPHQKLVSKLEALSDYMKIASVDELIIKKSLKSSFRDFEDAIQYQTAISVKGIRILVTRNIKDFKESELAVMTPETFLSTFHFSGGSNEKQKPGD